MYIATYSYQSKSWSQVSFPISTEVPSVYYHVFRGTGPHAVTGIDSNTSIGYLHWRSGKAATRISFKPSIYLPNWRERKALAKLMRASTISVDKGEPVTQEIMVGLIDAAFEAGQLDLTNKQAMLAQVRNGIE